MADTVNPATVGLLGGLGGAAVAGIWNYLAARYTARTLRVTTEPAQRTERERVYAEIEERLRTDLKADNESLRARLVEQAKVYEAECEELRAATKTQREECEANIARLRERVRAMEGARTALDRRMDTMQAEVLYLRGILRRNGIDVPRRKELEGGQP